MTRHPSSHIFFLFSLLFIDSRERETVEFNSKKSQVRINFFGRRAILGSRRTISRNVRKTSNEADKAARQAPPFKVKIIISNNPRERERRKYSAKRHWGSTLTASFRARSFAIELK